MFDITPSTLSRCFQQVAGSPIANFPEANFLAKVNRMCDQDHFNEDSKKYTRRDFGTLAAAGLGAGFGAAVFFPSSADAAEVTESDVTITTPDGECDAYFVAPGTGSHAAVLILAGHFRLAPRV